MSSKPITSEAAKIKSITNQHFVAEHTKSSLNTELGARLPLAQLSRAKSINFPKTTNMQNS